jgi:DMSO/TMAO reductase YedYZ molybdopterin-dependent catalytic subunit
VRAALGAEACPPPAVVPPTPAALPDGFYGLDRSTGLHVTGRAPAVDLGTYRLSVIGRVDSPLSLSYDEVRCMPKVKTTCALVCPGFFTDTATWQGVPLDYLLSLAGVQSGAESLVLVSADDYRTPIRLDTARAANGFLAYEWGDEPLPILHGFPVRAVFPGVEGNKWAKWLVRIEVH